jgi:hypothetical protein
MSKTIIKCLNANGTYLKITNEQSTHDSNEFKIFVPVDTELELTDISALDKKNHYAVTLLEPENERTAYVIYSYHWFVVSTDDPDIKSNDPPATIKQTVKPSTVVVSKYIPFVQKQINSLSKYSPTGKVNLNTSCVYFSQRDNDVMPHRTCNSSSNAMYLNWLQRASGQSKVLTDDDVFVQSVLKRGDTIYHGVITEALKAYGFNTVWDTTEDYSKLKETVLAGFVVPVNILHRGTKSNPRGGHIICLVGYRQSGDWITMDPYGTLDSGYTNPNGKHAFLSRADFQSRWQGGARYLM